MTVQEAKRSAPRGSSQPLQGKPSRPVLWWAGIGLAMTIVMLITIGQWLVSDIFRPVPIGSDTPPSWLPSWLLIVQIFFTGTALIFMTRYLFVPWFRDGHLGWDGRFLIACTTIWYQDPMDNYFNFTFTYNGMLKNQGSWSNFIPGWQSPGAENFPEPYFFIGAFFVWVFFLISIIGCWLLKKARIWAPGLSIVSYFALLFILFAIFDFVMETIMVRTGIISYVAVFSPLALFDGTPNQFPLYESTGIAAVCLGVTYLRYSRNDRGESLVERGLESLRFSAPAKRGLSLLAQIAAIQIIVFVGFYGQYQWFALKADTFAAYPSYRLMEICGRGTPYACPTSEVPMPKRGSLSIGPDDPRLSEASRRN